MAKTQRKGGSAGGFGHGVRAWANLALILPIASCVPALAGSGPTVQLQVANAPSLASADAPAAPQASAATGVLPAFDVAASGGSLEGSGALAANASLPIALLPSPAAPAYAFRTTTPIDQMRSLDCLTQAIYYEAGNQSEDGQRAVAQVVLNRVRHPAWPNSVCGVVYQGAMRPGGGCQFTFTCDGSLARTPGRLALGAGPALCRGGAGRAQLRAGRPVDLLPRQLRLPGLGAAAGQDGDDRRAHLLPPAGPVPARRARSATPMRATSRSCAAPPTWPAAAPARSPAVADAPAFAAGSYRPASARRAPVPSDIPQDPRWTPSNLPQSGIREEHAAVRPVAHRRAGLGDRAAR